MCVTCAVRTSRWGPDDGETHLRHVPDGGPGNLTALLVGLEAKDAHIAAVGFQPADHAAQEGCLATAGGSQ